MYMQDCIHSKDDTRYDIVRNDDTLGRVYLMIIIIIFFITSSYATIRFLQDVGSWRRYRI